MARGFLSGIFWGSFVSVIGAGAVSVFATDPVAPVAEDVAPRSETAPEAGDSGATAAVNDADLALQGEARQGDSPQADTVTAASVAGADTPTVPETGGAEHLSDPADVPETGPVIVNEVAPVQPAAPAVAPDAPGAEDELSISTDPAQPAAPEVPEASGAFAPEAEAEQGPTLTAETPAPSTPDAAQAPDSPTQSDTPPPPANLPTVDTEQGADAPVADAPNDTAGGPAIGRPATSLIERDGAVPDTADASDPESRTDTRAIVANAAAFENPDDKPLMAIVLIDSGVDLTSGPIGLAALQSFPYPLTFAVDATLEDATQRTDDYRAQGFEVMALVDLPTGATPGDTEVTLSAALDAVPEAVAVIEGTGTGLQDTRDVSEQVAQALLATGHGLLLQSKGLNTAQKMATRAGVPAGLIFRDFDSADQTPTVIRRFLDQAAFRAGVEGGVIMVGRVRPDTISALLLWGLQDRAARVALAPVSAVLTDLSVPE